MGSASSPLAVDAGATSPVIEVRSPRDGQVIGTVPMTSPEALTATVAAARRAQPAWAALSMKERVRRARNIRDRWLERAADLSIILQQEGGKSEIEALMSEVVPSVDLFDYWLKAAPQFLVRENISLNPLNFPGKRGYIDYEPVFDVGPLINERQLAKVKAHIDEAKPAGTKMWSGGSRLGDKGYWIAPTLFEAPTPAVSLYKEETFGPALAYTVVEDEAEAIRLANDTEFGLSASVWMRDLKRGERVAHALNVGAITVNNTSFTPVIPNAPWAGRKASGHGATNSHRALAEMVRTRFVLLDKSKGGELWWFPHDEGLLALARVLVRFVSRRLGTKLGALPSVLKLMPRRQKALAKPVI